MKNRVKRILIMLISVTILLFSFGCARNSSETTKVKSSKKTSKTQKIETEDSDEDEPVISTTKEQTTTTTEATTEATTTTESTTVETEEQTYEHNEYYDIVQVGKYKNSIGTHYTVHKVIAKKDISISSTAIAYDDNGDVVGKSTSEACLTAGQTNFFLYYFDQEVKDENVDISASTRDDSWGIGPRSAVKMVKWNQSGDDLYITLEQTDELGSFSKIKVILYKDGEIVGTEDGYLSVYAEGLTGKGSTDVVSLWVYGKKFDDIEVIYEP